MDVVRKVMFILWSCSLTGCMTLPAVSPQRMGHATEIARQGKLFPSIIQTPLGAIQSFARLDVPGDPVTVYIEGDGVAWRSRTCISDDPTPIHPVALQLAVEDPSSNVVYLARPCQYVTGDACSYSLWTSARFSEGVIASMNVAVDQYKQLAQAPSVDLVGFSGGAAVAVLIAQRRSDVTRIRTVAGNLDPTALNHFHHVSPLTASLDPMKEARKIALIPQQHLVGKNDTLVPRFVAENFKKASGSPESLQIELVEGVSHMDGWPAYWKKKFGGTKNLSVK